MTRAKTLQALLRAPAKPLASFTMENKMTHMRALSLLHGMANFTCLDEASDCLEWARQHPEEINTGSLQRAVQALESLEGGSRD